MKHLYPNSNKDKEFFEAIPVRGLIFVLKKLHLYDLFEKYARDGRTKQGPIQLLLF
jgi:hypothetical protein